jgi:hypothetical protein
MFAFISMKAPKDQKEVAPKIEDSKQAEAPI